MPQTVARRGPASGPRAATLLRAATAAHHARAEAAADLPGRLRRVEDFAVLLGHLEAFHRAVEDRIASTVEQPGVPEALRAGWRRAPLLRADLVALGARAADGAPAPVAGPVPDLPTPAHRRGAWYVLEGSRLGGELVAREVARALPGAATATTGLRAGAGAGRRWQAFRRWLDEAPAAEDAAVVAGAAATFDALDDRLRPA